MSLCSFNTSLNALVSAGKNEVSPQLGQGQYIGIYYPGSTQKVISTVGALGGTTNLGAELVIQTDLNYISSLQQTPQNVLRFAGSYGTSYIQGSNIAFSMPYSGTVGLRILPSTNTINVNNVNTVSTLNTFNGKNINMIQLASTIQGYGWANVA